MPCRHMPLLVHFELGGATPREAQAVAPLLHAGVGGARPAEQSGARSSSVAPKRVSENG